VVGDAPLFDVYFTENEITDYRSTLGHDKETLGRFNRLLLERGIMRGSSKFYVSTAHTQEDVDRTIDAFASAIDELRG
jgi:glutamate-1-semialdehyde 2,1-aminomutase